jgi:gamma-glutamylcyclotransferase (GGCT)/AIG2-like uncharacterized protein YtfP
MVDATGAERRLATYGTLAPGRPNAHILEPLHGEWVRGVVKGRLVEQGWGAALGYPALVLEADGPPVEVHLFTSADLPQHWERLDAFEGDGYCRVPVEVETAQGTFAASIYVLAEG